MTRRDALKKGAIVTAAAAWTVPLVQMVSMTPAHAESPSGAGARPMSHGASVGDPNTTPVAADASKPGSSLAFTGSNITPTVLAGTATAVAGAGLVAASRRKRAAVAETATSDLSADSPEDQS